MQETDPAAVRAAAAGDLDAFDGLVRTYQEPVWRFLVGLVGDRALAEDLAQDTFLRAYRNLGGFEFRSRFSTWLFTIARNVATDALRSRASQRRALARLARQPSDERPDPALAAAMDEALSSLSHKLREAILLVEIAGFTCKDAGSILGVAEGTIKSRLYYARRDLAKWFSEDDGEVADDGL
ncbi:MAG TPA: RNA polymerase sigma factor [Nitriliruptorales bacterium]|nr:RNA polymerase sigma factor [Nitriliruptorales bacterium]